MTSVVAPNDQKGNIFLDNCKAAKNRGWVFSHGCEFQTISVNECNGNRGVFLIGQDVFNKPLWSDDDDHVIECWVA
jgi:hypothetical protein